MPWSILVVWWDYTEKSNLIRLTASTDHTRSKLLLIHILPCPQYLSMLKSDSCEWVSDPKYAAVK